MAGKGRTAAAAARHLAAPVQDLGPDPSVLITPERARTVKGRGFEMRSVAGAGRTIHRDG
ncbi:hypothetical protein [Streptomyces yangpuensis]|uniref:hypothetical protein n=1 Tax=Streptomyces yangpuensis TaxID=1648182 RepID=UPI0035D7C3E9